MITPCDVCGNVELNWDRDWAVSDQEWRQVVPEKWRDKILCPWCFVKFAAEHGKEYQVTFYPWDPSIASGAKRVEGKGRMSLDDMRRELRENYERLKKKKSNLEIEECATCGEEQPVKYHLSEYPKPGILEGTFEWFCSDECLCLYVKAYKCF